MEKKLLFIVNPRAGRRKTHAPLYDAISEFCAGGYLVYVHNTTGHRDATDYIRAHGADYDLVVCYGGDGTLNETINGVQSLPSPPPVGYIPAGTTNDFATTLGISADPVTAARAIMAGNVRHLDMGSFNGRRFAYVASFGAFTRASYMAPQSSKNLLGHTAYVLEGVKDISSLRVYQASIRADEELLEGDFLFGSVSNTTSLGGVIRLSADHVTMDDGKFELLLVKKPETLLELQNLVGGILTQEYNNENLLLRHVSRLEICTKEPLEWALDGEREAAPERVQIENQHKKLAMMM